jgi:hypothetical protein
MANKFLIVQVFESYYKIDRSFTITVNSLEEAQALIPGMKAQISGLLAIDNLELPLCPNYIFRNWDICVINIMIWDEDVIEGGAWVEYEGSNSSWFILRKYGIWKQNNKPLPIFDKDNHWPGIGLVLLNDEEE